MITLSKYWHLWCINPANDQLGYQSYVMPSAQTLIQSDDLGAKPPSIQSVLLSYFYAEGATLTPRNQAQAGLCLRCFVSAAILKSCRMIDHLFGGDKAFTYRDLLPFVLDDDGKTSVIIDRDRKAQLMLMDNGSVQVNPYRLFAVEVLRTFKVTPSSLSLENWAFFRTKQNAEIKKFLTEFGFRHLSDWALLNRVKRYQLEQLTERDRHLVHVFHEVYRRDRRKQLGGSRRCPDPSDQQLQEMIANLQKNHDIMINESELMQALKLVATQLKQYDVWSQRVPLEVHNSETGYDTVRSDLPSHETNELDLDQQELLAFFQQQLDSALNAAIAQGLNDRIATLERSPKYAKLASQLIPGLRLYYEQGLSLREIAPILGMSSWDQTRRVLNPGDLLSQVRALTVQQVLDRLLEKAQQKGLASVPPDPNYLRTLAEQVEATLDEDIFHAAVEEMRAGQSRVFTSLYAQKLRGYLNQPVQK